MRRYVGRRHKRAIGKRLIVWSASGLLLVATIWYLAFVSRFLRSADIPSNRSREGKVVGCIGWRQTRSCTPYGVRDVGGDKDCQAWISKNSGYCECGESLTVNRVYCGRYRSFTCDAACERLADDALDAEPLPKNVTCPKAGHQDSGLMRVAAGWLHQKPALPGASIHLSGQAKSVIKSLDIQASALWRSVWEASNSVAHQELRLPESRTVNKDWVRDGVHIPGQDVLAIREQWQSFLSKAPQFPVDMYNGKGIVILAGGPTYMVPAWVNIHMLRRTGCLLPVEMFFPSREYPTSLLESALASLGVTCRQLPDVGAQGGWDGLPNEAEHKAGLSGFTLKIAALILSQFREVLFLDSDNVPVADPASLFTSIEYLRTGALLWPDYWQTSAASDLAAILEVPDLPYGTFESGQMVFDKSRSWKGLMLAAFFNLNSDLYYELFSNYMGKGDKESFAHALQAAGKPFSTVRVPVGSIGEDIRQCQPPRRCKLTFLGNTMTQHSPDGQIMFLHTNLSPKWNLELPGEFLDYRRRWKVILPGRMNFLDVFEDLEHEVYLILVSLRCAPFLPSYIEGMRVAEGFQGDLNLGLYGFHPHNPGIDFHHAYRWGIPGPYLQFIKVSMLDRVVKLFNTSIRSHLSYSWRCILSLTQHFHQNKPYFVLTDASRHL